MIYNPEEKLAELLQRYEALYQKTGLPFKNEELIQPLELLVKSIAILAVKSEIMDEQDPADNIMIMLNAINEDALPSKAILARYQELATGDKLLPVFTEEEWMAMSVIYHLQFKTESFCIEKFHELLQNLSPERKGQFCEVVGRLARDHRFKSLCYFRGIHSKDWKKNISKAMKQVDKIYQEQERRKRLEEKENSAGISLPKDKKRKDYKSSDLVSNSFLGPNKNLKMASDTAHSHDYLYNGDDETVASHEYESKEAPQAFFPKSK